ncbi:MAG: hypothetical protein J0I90_05750 [Nitrosospira sp.]|nr:hypothetical protein [Nitrosospira sp.]
MSFVQSRWQRQRRQNLLEINSSISIPGSVDPAVEKLGAPRWIVGPNRIHYWWIPDWKNAYPTATVYLAPRIKEQARNRIDFDFTGLDDDRGYPWDREIATLPVRGKFMTEIEFFHYPSRTLLLTDSSRTSNRKNSTLSFCAG